MIYDVIVVGAGLSGLVAAERLKQTAPELAVRLLEARNRPGGRILTVPTAVAGVGLDLGPTWFWDDQPYLQALLQRLGLAAFQQYEEGATVFDPGAGRPLQRFVPDWQQPISYRIVGGVQAVITALLERLPAGLVAYEQVVQQVAQQEGSLQLVTRQGEVYEARQVVVTLPPRLAAGLTFAPPLPAAVFAALAVTPTWMGQAMKVGLVYERPFWREAGLSGMAVSYSGPVQQFHDASPAGGEAGALFGWLGNESAGRRLAPEERRQAVIAQAARLFGPEAAAPLDYAECNWQREPFTSTGTAAAVAEEHPNYGLPLLQQPQMEGRLHWAGTEVAPVSGGYLDGAVFIGEAVAGRVRAGATV